nr:TonB-dependent receptor [Bacteroidota bacterium]
MFIPFFSFAQILEEVAPAGSEGLVVDANTNKPVPFSTAALMQPGNTLPLATMLVSDNGTFAFKASANTFYVRVSFLGYTTFVSDTFNLDVTNKTRKLKIKLSPTATQLNEVEVSGQKNYAQNNLDRKVYTIDKDLVAVGGSASDALKQIPAINLDQDNNVNMRGSDNLQILVDGRPSGMLGGDNQSGLEQLPASSIERIEVISNPSSQFDAAGTGGIINIVLKKNVQKGFNGNASVNVSTRNKYGANVGINAMYKKLNVFASYAIRDARNLMIGTLDRTATFVDTAFTLEQSSRNITKQTTHTFRTGGDYQLSKSASVTTSINFNRNDGSRDENIYYDNFLLQPNYPQQFVSQQLRTNAGNDWRWSYDIAAGFRKSFAAGKAEWNTDATYSRNARSDNQDATIKFFDGFRDFVESQSMLQNFKVGNGLQSLNTQSDVTWRATKKIKIDGGAKYFGRTSNNSLNQYESEFTNNNHILSASSTQFSFTENITAAYVMGLYSIGKVSVQAGLRNENTFNQFKYKDSESTSRSFNHFFPSVFFRYNSSATNEIGASYGKRIQRPNAEQQNPFTDFSDPQNIRVGNPNLVPELIHSFELSNKKIFSFTTLNTTLYYRYNQNHIQRFRKVTSDGFSVMTFINSAWRKDYGVEISATGDITKWWNVLLNVNFFNQEINAGNIEQNLGRKGFSWSTRMNNNFKLQKTLTAQLSGSYNSIMRGAQGQLQPVYSADVAIKKDWMKSKYSLTIGLADIFDTRIFQVRNTSTYFDFEFERKRDTRILTFTFNYRFGRFDDKQKQQRNNDKQNDRPGGEMDF